MMIIKKIPSGSTVTYYKTLRWNTLTDHGLAVQCTCHDNTVDTLFVSATLPPDYDANQRGGHDGWAIVHQFCNIGY